MSWDEEAPSWDEEPAVRAYNMAAFQSLLSACDARQLSLESARVLDFGCGTGLLTEAVAARAIDVVALDSSSAMIEVLRGKIAQSKAANVLAVHGELATLLDVGEQALARPFDLVTCSSVCAFLDDYPATARRLASRLTPGGLFVQWDWESDPDEEEPFGLSRGAIRAALQGAGLGDVSVEVGFREPFEGVVMAPLMGLGCKV